MSGKSPSSPECSAGPLGGPPASTVDEERQGLGLRSTSLKIAGLAVFAFLLFGPLANLVLWSVAERWYTPFKLPVTYGLRYWEVVFRPTGDAMSSLATSVSIACLTVLVALAVSIPAGYALARLGCRGARR